VVVANAPNNRSGVTAIVWVVVVFVVVSKTCCAKMFFLKFWWKWAAPLNVVVSGTMGDGLEMVEIGDPKLGRLFVIVTFPAKSGEPPSIVDDKAGRIWKSLAEAWVSR